MRRHITEYLDLDLEREMWCCHRCGGDLISAREDYKRGCLLYERDPTTVHERIGPDPEFNYSVHPEWCRIIEFYCPLCGVMMDNEYLPPGHPITRDIELDIDALKAVRAGGGTA